MATFDVHGTKNINFERINTCNGRPLWISKNRSIRSCAPTFVNCIHWSFPEQANLTRENRHSPIKIACAPLASVPAPTLAQQVVIALICLTTEINLSAQILGRKRYSYNKNKN